VKISRDRLIEIIQEELKENFSPEDESIMLQTKMNEEISAVKQALMKLKMMSQGERTIATSVPHSADTEDTIANSFAQSINIMEMEIAKLEAQLGSERYSHQQYKE
jgi:hypothetical protein